MPAEIQAARCTRAGWGQWPVTILEWLKSASKHTICNRCRSIVMFDAIYFVVTIYIQFPKKSSNFLVRHLAASASWKNHLLVG